LAEATSLCSMTGKDRLTENNLEAHVVVPLMGRFKGETEERNVLCLMASVTKLGIAIRRWTERVVFLLKKEGRNVGEPDPFVIRTASYLLVVT